MAKIIKFQRRIETMENQEKEGSFDPRCVVDIQDRLTCGYDNLKLTHIKGK
jgi:hypothetical protein